MTDPEWTDEQWRETVRTTVAIVRAYRDPAHADGAVWQLLGEPLDHGRILLNPQTMAAVIRHLVVMVVQLGDECPETVDALLDREFAESLTPTPGQSG